MRFIGVPPFAVCIAARGMVDRKVFYAGNIYILLFFMFLYLYLTYILPDSEENAMGIFIIGKCGLLFAYRERDFDSVPVGGLCGGIYRKPCDSRNGGCRETEEGFGRDDGGAAGNTGCFEICEFWNQQSKNSSKL